MKKKRIPAQLEFLFDPAAVQEFELAAAQQETQLAPAAVLEPPTADELFKQPVTEVDPWAGLFELIGEGDLLRAMRSTFKDIEIAEAEIDKAKINYPDSAQAIDSMFIKLQRPAMLREYGDKLYAAHCRELIYELAVKKVKHCVATSAQVCAVMARCSELAPLTQDATALYFKHFVIAMGKEAAETMMGGNKLGDFTRETYSGAIAELEHVLYRKLDNRSIQLWETKKDRTTT